MAEQLLREVAQSTINAAGVGTVQIGPVPWAQSWRFTSVSIESTSTAPTKATIYRNNALDSNRVDVTPNNTGNKDTTDTVIELLAGERLVIVWTGGDVGARVSATAEGYLRA